MKARVVAAVEGGLLTQVAACARYEMSFEEYRTWRAQTIARNYPHLAWLIASLPAMAPDYPEAELPRSQTVTTSSGDG
jgi:hypothetical protein